MTWAWKWRWLFLSAIPAGLLIGGSGALLGLHSILLNVALGVPVYLLMLYPAWRRWRRDQASAAPEVEQEKPQ